MSSDYHHGHLPAALMGAAVELITERGPAAFSLREVARRAGVSHAAPAHHFGDARGLLTAVAAEGYELLAAAIHDEVANVTDASERLRLAGRAYVRTALENPGHYGVMVGKDYINVDDPDCLRCSIGAYAQLLETVEAIRDQLNPKLDVDSAATLCWAAMHGLVEMAPILEHVAESTNTTTSPLQELVDSFTAMLIEGLRER